MDGRFYTTDNWTSGSNATGVAVITDKARLIVAPNEWHTNNGSDDGAWNGNKTSAWGGFEKIVSGIVTTFNGSTALADFAGSSNTDQIIAQLKGTTDSYSSYYTGAPAAEYCRAYSKGCKGVGEWYLPAAGEMDVLATNKDTINTALTAISGETLGSVNQTWMSTQRDEWFAWCYDWEYDELYNDYFTEESKESGIGVRPICQL